MQVIILALLTFSALAQKGGIQCDPKEAERQCYSMLCSSTKPRPIAVEREELIKAFEAHPYTLDPRVAHEIEKVEGLSGNIQTSFRELLDKNEVQGLSEKFIDMPLDYYRYFMSLFDGDMKCIETDGNCEVIFSDLSGYPEASKDFVKTWSEMTYIYREGIVLPIQDQRKHLIRAIDRMRDEIPKAELETEKRKISHLKEGMDFSDYLRSAGWLKSYENKIKKTLLEKRPLMDELLKIKLKELSGKDPKAVSRRTYRSCQLADYLSTTLERGASEEKFKAAVDKALRQFKDNFLSRLSKESAGELAARLVPEKFHLLKNETSYLPIVPNYGVHFESYRKPEETAHFISDMLTLKNFDNHQCSSRGFVPGDAFHFGTEDLYVSQFTVANDYESVIIHELGHWMSKQLVTKNLSSHSRRKLEKVRKCVRSYYPEEKFPSAMYFKHKKDHIFVEEDFADWVASVTGPAVPGFYCELDKLLINIAGVVQESSYLPQSGDNHSNQLFREITTRLNRGEKLPQVCHDLIDVHPHMKPKQCSFK